MFCARRGCCPPRADALRGAPGEIANWCDASATDAGVGYVVFGRASGFPAQLAASDLNGRNGIRLNDHFGITAQQTGKAKIRFQNLPLSAGADNLLLDPESADFRLVDFA